MSITRNIGIRAGVIVLSLSLAGPAAHAADIFMDDNPSGLGPYDGSSWENAVRNWTELAAVLAYQDTVHVKEGTYATVGVSLGTWATFLGGYPQANTGTQTTGRDPVNLRPVLNSDTTNRVLQITTTTVLNGFTIQNGGGVDRGAGINCVGGDVTIQYCLIQNNSITVGGAAILQDIGGGGLMADTAGTLTVEETTFTNNSFTSTGGAGGTNNAIIGGGGARTRRSSTFTRCTFSFNNCNISTAGVGTYRGGGGGAMVSNPAGTFTFDRCQFLNNSVATMANSAQGGGGLWMQSNTGGTHVTNLTNCYFYNNTSNYYGSALGGPAQTGHPMTLNAIHCTFDRNPIAVQSNVESIRLNQDTAGASSFNFLNCIFSNNTGGNGTGPATIRSSTAAGANDVIDNCLFFGNTANDVNWGTRVTNPVAGADPGISAGNPHISGTNAVDKVPPVTPAVGDIDCALGSSATRIPNGGLVDVGCDEDAFVPVTLSGFHLE